MDRFWKESHPEEIYARDRWQFEIKSEFAPIETVVKNFHEQEFFIFIPNSLLFNSQNYTSQNFFKDQTNFIRYKTPILTFQEIKDLDHPDSPFFRLRKEKILPKKAEEELRLLGNIIRSALRKEVWSVVNTLQQQLLFNASGLNQKIKSLCKDWKEIRSIYHTISQQLQKKKKYLITYSIAYIDEFLSNTADYYFIGLLREMRQSKEILLEEADAEVCSLLTSEKQLRAKYFAPYASPHPGTDPENDVFYRQRILNKYVIEVLQLSATRDAFMNTHRNLIGSIAAGVAMFVFLMLVLLFYSIQAFRDTEPYIFFTVIFYILKDRIKEGLRAIPSIRGFNWLSNYKTNIRSPDELTLLGTLVEFFSFLDSKDISPDIQVVRNRYSSDLKRPEGFEKVMYYKKRVRLNLDESSRKSMLNIISRFDLSEFAFKAGDPYRKYSTLDPITHEIIETDWPKIYSIHIILKSTFTQKDLSRKSEIRAFRLIIDKNGLKDIEQLP